MGLWWMGLRRMGRRKLRKERKGILWQLRKEWKGIVWIKWLIRQERKGKLRWLGSI
jgi:hypothetical protein